MTDFIAPSKLTSITTGKYILSNTLQTDPEKVSISPDGLNYKFKNETYFHTSVLCEPCIPLEGAHSFSATYISSKEGYEAIGLA